MTFSRTGGAKLQAWHKVVLLLVLGAGLLTWGYLSSRQKLRNDILAKVRAEHCFVMGDLYAVSFGPKTPEIRQAPLLRLISSVGAPHSVLFEKCQPTDEALLEISRMKQIKWLSIDGSLFDDQKMRLLAGADHLRAVFLSHNDVSDESIPILAEMQELVELGVGHTRITATGIERIRRARPNIAIQFTPLNLKK